MASREEQFEVLGQYQNFESSTGDNQSRQPRLQELII
jgi:hypothetical protein